jgi:hypothetical protein
VGRSHRIALASGLLAGAVQLLGGTAARGVDPCLPKSNCCVHSDACVVTDKQALAAITVDAMVPGGVGSFLLGTYVTGGDGVTGVAPNPVHPCGLSNELIDMPPETALADVDHLWLASFETPKVLDFGALQNTVFVFVAVDHSPFPEEGIESTVWGSDSPDISTFPEGWQLATLSTIWKQGWEEPAACEPGDNADDFVGQYTFPDPGFRYIAVHANYSITIFDDPSHASWSSDHDDSSLPGWQTDDDEIDAVGAPLCAPGAVSVDAGDEIHVPSGGEACVTGSASSDSGIVGYTWDLDGDGEVDTAGADACIACSAFGEFEARLFAVDAQGCAGSAALRVVCDCPAEPIAGCRTSLSPKGSSLKLKASKGSLAWSWSKGPATEKADFGDPTASTAYRLCLYGATEGTPAVALDASIPPGAEWKETGKGFNYKGSGADSDGVRKVKLKTGKDGKSRIRLAAKDLSLPALPLGQDPEVVIQLHQSEGTCFESRFAAPAKRNDASTFKDKSN